MRKMKYYYYSYVFRDGENSYYKDAVVSCHESDDVEEIINKYILADMWGDATEKDGDIFYSPTGEVAVRLSTIKEIPKSHYDVLKQYLHHDEIKPEPEKVEFT